MLICVILSDAVVPGVSFVPMTLMLQMLLVPGSWGSCLCIFLRSWFLALCTPPLGCFYSVSSCFRFAVSGSFSDWLVH